MILPNFIVLGPPRSGTRWMAKCLAEHPQIGLPPEEVYFFTTRRVVVSNWSNGLEWYSSLFEECMGPDIKTYGEVTPVYLFDEDTPLHMHQCIPDAKLICCLRDQTERAYSWYRLFLHFNPEIFNTNYSFKSFLTYHNDVYGREGFYLEHLQRYLSLYQRESVHILLYDDLIADPVRFIQNLYSYLKVDSTFVPPSVHERINPMELELSRSKILQDFSKRLKQTDNFQRIRLPMISDAIDRINTIHVARDKFPSRHQLDPIMRNMMAELYQEHNKQLGGFLGRDLSHWNHTR